MFNLSKGIGREIATIKDNQKYPKNKYKLCISDGKNIDSDIKLYDGEIKLENGSFQLTCDKSLDRTTMYICGSAGSGKSYFCCEWLKEYHRIYPNNPIYLICESDEDPLFDELDYVHRIDLEGIEHEDDKGFWQEFKDCCIVFDDIDGMTGKLKKCIYTLRDKLLKNSRKFHVSVISTAHNACNAQETKSVLNESNIIVFFLMNYNKSMKYLLESYIGLDKKAIEKLRKLKSSRWTAYIKGYPSLILQDKFCSSVEKFEES